MSEKELYTTPEAAEFLTVSISFLQSHRFYETGKIPFIRLGRSVRYRREDLERILREGVPNGCRSKSYFELESVKDENNNPTWANALSNTMHRKLLKELISMEYSEFHELLDQNHDYYAPELAIAVKCWIELVSKGLKRKTGIKKHIKDWLKSHNSDLTENALEMIAAIVNPKWNKKKRK